MTLRVHVELPDRVAALARRLYPERTWDELLSVALESWLVDRAPRRLAQHGVVSEGD